MPLLSHSGLSSWLLNRLAKGLHGLMSVFHKDPSPTSYSVDQRVLFVDQFLRNWLEKLKEGNALARIIGETPTA